MPEATGVAVTTQATFEVDGVPYSPEEPHLPLCTVYVTADSDGLVYLVLADQPTVDAGEDTWTYTLPAISNTVAGKLRFVYSTTDTTVDGYGDIEAGKALLEAFVRVGSSWIAAAQNASDKLDDLTDPAGVLELSEAAMTNAGGGGATAEDIFEADPADYDDDADSFAARFLRMLVSTGMIGSAYVKWVGYVSEDGKSAVVFKGREHRYDYGTSLPFKVSTSLSITGATFRFNGTDFTCTVVAAPPDSDYTHDVYVDVHASVTETSAFEVGPYPFFLYPITSDSADLPALISGTVRVVDEPG